MKISKTLIISSLLFFVFQANAASDMKPGLWQDNFTIKSKTGKLEKKLATLQKKLLALPPDQRQMMEAAMASQGAGLSLNSNSVKICISKEQAENLALPKNAIKKCKQEEVSRTANQVKLKFTCGDNPASTGDGEFNLINPTTYSARAHINTFEDGEPEILNIKQNGKWISADCGNIKSVPLKK